MEYNICDEIDEKIGKGSAVAKQFRYAYTFANKKANDNKKKYLKSQRAIIHLSFAASVINVFITVASATLDISWILSIASGTASVIMLISAMISKKLGFYKYFETWQRHRSHSMKLGYEAMCFLSKTEDYKGKRDEEAFDIFKKNLCDIIKNNNEKYAENMTNFDVDLGVKLSQKEL